MFPSENIILIFPIPFVSDGSPIIFQWLEESNVHRLQVVGGVRKQCDHDDFVMTANVTQRVYHVRCVAINEHYNRQWNILLVDPRQEVLRNIIKGSFARHPARFGQLKCLSLWKSVGSNPRGHSCVVQYYQWRTHITGSAELQRDRHALLLISIHHIVYVSLSSLG